MKEITVPMIRAKKEKLGKDLLMNFYISDKTILVVPQWIARETGVLVEQENVYKLEPSVKLEVLGRHALEALLKMEKKDIDLREDEVTDWPAYEASGMKTKKSFKRGFKSVSVRTVHQIPFLSIECEVRSSRYEGIVVSKMMGLHVSPGPEDAILGQSIMRVYEAAGELEGG